MFDFFTDPYKDEILYSVIARYHYYAGNTSYVDTLMEFFGTITNISVIEFPRHLSVLESRFQKGTRYTSEYFMNQHSLFPYYEPFLPSRVKDSYIHEMKYSPNHGMQFALLKSSIGNLCKQDKLRYCPICTLKDIETHDEAYFHRIHQIPGVFVCPEHNCKLKNYPIEKENVKFGHYVKFNTKHLDMELQYNTNIKLKEVADSISYVLKNDLSGLNKEELDIKYLRLLVEKGFALGVGHIKRAKFKQEFVNYYGSEFLTLMDSNIDLTLKTNWIDKFIIKSFEFIHPIRHILVILFLCKNIQSFFDKQIKGVDLNLSPKRPNVFTINTERRDRYRTEILQYIKDNPGSRRIDLSRAMSKQRRFLFEKDREWFEANMPAPIPPKGTITALEARVNWENRDDELLNLIKKAQLDILNEDKPTRISSMLIAKKTGRKKIVLNLLSKYKDKLPMSSNYLSAIIETSEEFYLRKIDYICRELYQEKGFLKRHEILHKASLTRSYKQTPKIRERIQYNISVYNS